jgi:hypothetical protein
MLAQSGRGTVCIMHGEEWMARCAMPCLEEAARFRRTRIQQDIVVRRRGVIVLVHSAAVRGKSPPLA